MMMVVGNGNLRVDLKLIADMVEPGSRVLDVGCGEGALLDWLGRNKNVDGRGIELSMAGVSAAVSHGLSVIQGDADTDLKDYPSGAFDYVILSQTLQATYEPKTVLANMLRIGRRAIVSFPNFGHWRVRTHLLFRGSMPVTDTLAYEWFDTPNIHFCTIRDFLTLFFRHRDDPDIGMAPFDDLGCPFYRIDTDPGDLFTDHARRNIKSRHQLHFFPLKSGIP